MLEEGSRIQAAEKGKLPHMAFEGLVTRWSLIFSRGQKLGIRLGTTVMPDSHTYAASQDSSTLPY
jgi:hypothetical protein